MIFLDEPINSGFSHSSDGSTANSLSDVAVDVYAFLTLFLTLFLTRCPPYASAPFYLAAESWGSHYGPHIVNLIYKKNSELEYAPRPGMKKINLASSIIANGLTDPSINLLQCLTTCVAVVPIHRWTPMKLGVLC
ncbi:hypothetical protein AcW2_000036 [Taiwanofungus camphoratus]|nr:hypothetical protein AcW2_000036 [Antrodia cinnamomea]